MTKGSEYITRVIKQVVAEERSAQSFHQGAFLAAALSIISEVESPLKDRALVSLASLATRTSKNDAIRRRRAAAF
jgi:hypothetical protein